MFIQNTLVDSNEEKINIYKYINIYITLASKLSLKGTKQGFNC